jgi:hypothetical protein
MNIETTVWADVRNEVKEVNPELAAIIDAIYPTKNYPLIKARYGYGDLIIKEGSLQLPFNGDCINYRSTKLDKTLNRDLLYNSLPLGVFTKNAGEVFLETQTKVLPLKVFDEGDLFGVFEALDYIMEKPSLPKWSVSSGSRTVFSLPKISDLNGIKRLRSEYGIPSTLQVKTQQDHWGVFKYIARKESDWEAEIIFFTKPWLDNFNDPAWSEFFRYLFSVGWDQSKLPIEKILSAHTWQKFSNALSFRNLKPHPYIVDTARHLLLMSKKSGVGILPALDGDKHLLPLTKITDALVDVYKLKNYLPTIMLTKPLASLGAGDMAYYSLSYPTNVDGSVSHYSKAKTIFSDLRDLKSLLDTFRNSDQENEEVFFDHSEFLYFHIENDIYGEIPNSKRVESMDERFLQPSTSYPGREFCYSSLFFRGCIAVRYS